jgi:hypothetical protein
MPAPGRVKLSALQRARHVTPLAGMALSPGTPPPRA